MSNKIHFLNTGFSDCIILESNGHFAMVDSGEDSEYPADKPNLNLPGYEDKVVDYLINNCSNKAGKVVLDFIVATHSHSDHIGGFDTVILNPNVEVKKAYVRKYNSKNIFIMERKYWDNQEVYDQLIDALNKTKTPVINEFNGQNFKMEDFNISLMYGKEHKGLIKYGENVNSVVTLVECNGVKTLLAGDMNYKAGDEKRVAKQVGKVDVLKVGHHGYFGSTSLYFIKKLMPKYAVVTNYAKRIFPDVRFKLEKISKAKIYSTADSNGVILKINNDGTYETKCNIEN